MVTTEKDKHELWKRLWFENEQRLKRLCNYKLSGHRDEIEDILADTMLALWDAICKDKNIGRPEAWLYGTASNLINRKYKELYKEKDCRVAFDEENLKLYSLNVGYDSDFALLPEDITERFSDVLDPLLSTDEKQLLTYIYEEKLKMKEIAVILSSTESAVKQKHYRLARKIKRLIKEYLKNY